MKPKLVLRLLSCSAMLAFTSFCADAQQPVLIGITRSGGEGAGAVMKINADGSGFTHTDLPVQNPGAISKNFLVAAPDGKLYGLARGSGISATRSVSILFAYDPVQNTYEKKHIFLDSSEGVLSCTGLLPDSNGKLYGVTSAGGANGCGVVFEYDVTSAAYAKKADLTLNQGKLSLGELMQSQDGNLYGMCRQGGANGKGTIFRYNKSAASITKLYDFDSINGAEPWGGLTQGADGKLYGLTSKGGAGNVGVLFEFDPLTLVTTKRVDLSTALGSTPYYGTMQRVGDVLYGLTSAGGGTGNTGVVFSFNTVSKTYTLIAGLTTSGLGSAPTGGFGTGPGGNLFAHSTQVLFELTMDSLKLRKKVDLTNNIYGGSSFAGKPCLFNGKLYGLVENAGTQGLNSSLYEYDPQTARLSKKIVFNTAPAGSDALFSGLMQASDGIFYGAARQGGSYNAGTIFSYDPLTNALTKKADFSTDTNSCGAPQGPLCWTSPYTLAGAATSGGSKGFGAAYEFDITTGSMKPDVSFTSLYGATGNLCKAPNGNFYGVTTSGYLYEYHYGLPSKITSKVFFDMNTVGYAPNDGMVLAHNGKLYGTLSEYKNGGGGSIYEYTPGQTSVRLRYAFTTAANGVNVYSGLVEGADGRLYGMTRDGGANGKGVIFSFDPDSGTYTKRFDFSDAAGAQPYGALTLAGNNKLYGATNKGGAYNEGVIFEFDPATGVYTKLKDLDYASGTNFFYGTSLTEYKAINVLADTLMVCSGDSLDFSARITGGFNTDNVFRVALWDTAWNGYGFYEIGKFGAYTTNASRVYIPDTVSGYIRMRVSSTSPFLYSNWVTIDVMPRPVRPVISNQQGVLVSSAPSGNQWYSVATGLLPGDTNTTYTPTINGKYYVVQTLAPCGPVSSDTLELVLTGINNAVAAKQILLFPNPVADKLHVSKAAQLQFVISNLQGMQVSSCRVGNDETIDVSGLVRGMYLIQLSAPDGTLVNHRFVKD